MRIWTRHRLNICFWIYLLLAQIQVQQHWSGAMAELLSNTEAMPKAQSKVEEVIGKGKLVEESDIALLPFLQGVIKETFRLHPVVFLLLPRKAEPDVEIGGYIVPKGALVQVNVWGWEENLSRFAISNENVALDVRFTNCFDRKLEDGVVPEIMNMEEKFGLTLQMAPKKS